MDTVELFSGIGGFRVAADECGFRTIWANDSSPKACKVYRDQFGKGELREGDLRQLLEDVPPHDLLTGGFPCQPFSSARKKKGIRDPRGTLFELIVQVLDRHRPQFFVLENVKRLLTMERGAHFATILSALANLDYHLEWRLLNAMHFGLPQNRQRVFIVGTAQSQGNTQNAGCPIQLASGSDLTLSNVSQLDVTQGASNWKPLEKHRERFPTWGLAIDDRFLGANLTEFSASQATVTLTTVLQEEVSEDFDFTSTTLGWVEKNQVINRFVQGVEILSNQAGGARMGYTIFGINGVAPTLTSTTSRHYERYKIGDRYRRLTNIEYARIQGFADAHCRTVSVYDQYALYGNAVPPPLAKWVLERLSQPSLALTELPEHSQQLELFST